MVLLAISLPLLDSHKTGTADDGDEVMFHRPVIQAFVDQFPHVDLHDYQVAMTPLYHLVLAFLVKYLGFNLLAMRLFTLLISVLCLVICYRYLASIMRPSKAALAAGMLMASPYYLGDTIRLSTELAGLLMVLMSMKLLERAGQSFRPYMIAAVIMAVCMLTRQLHVWLVAAGVYAAFVNRKGGGYSLALRNSLPFALPIAVLLPFFIMWGGLTTPTFSRYYQKSSLVNPDVITFSISLLGFIGIFFGFWYHRYFLEERSRLRHLVYILGATSLYLLVFPLHDAIREGTGGGVLWRLAVYAPTLASTSLLFWVLFPTGSVVLYVIWLKCRARKDYFILICLLLWLAANACSGRVYHGYYEFFLLFFTGYSLRYADNEPRYYWIGPAFLGIIFIALSVHRYNLLRLF